jgi:Spy/CpxP family protein refolding chaperone
VLLTVCNCLVVAEELGHDPLSGLLVSPDVILQHGLKIGLTDKQMANVRSRLEAAGRQGQEIQQRANAATGRLAELLSADPVDEEAALKQLDKLLTVENEQRRLHMRIMIQIRNELTPEQRQAAAQIGPATQIHGRLQQRLKTKRSQIEKAIQKRAAAGQPPFEAVELMQKFPEFMQRGQVDQAEALLNRVMALLDDNEQGGGERSLPDPQLPKTGDQTKTPKYRLPKRYSPEAVRAEFAALRKQDVAWRSIQWKNCLVDGIKASREQNKPIMLWIFIDRPIDDERC